MGIEFIPYAAVLVECGGPSQYRIEEDGVYFGILVYSPKDTICAHPGTWGAAVHTNDHSGRMQFEGYDDLEKLRVDVIEIMGKNFQTEAEWEKFLAALPEPS